MAQSPRTSTARSANARPSKRRTSSATSRGARTRTAEAPAPAPPGSALQMAIVQQHFGGVFTEYWQALQSRQAAVQARTAEAYQAFTAALQEQWAADGSRDRFAELCRAFGAATRDAAGDAGDEAAVADAYRAYVAALQGAWAEPEQAEGIERAYLAFTEAVQQANADVQQDLEAAKARYLRGLAAGWQAVNAEALDPAALAFISRSTVTTAFFTEGMQPTV